LNRTYQINKDLSRNTTVLCHDNGKEVTGTDRYQKCWFLYKRLHPDTHCSCDGHGIKSPSPLSLELLYNSVCGESFRDAGRCSLTSRRLLGFKTACLIRLQRAVQVGENLINPIEKMTRLPLPCRVIFGFHASSVF
jgi:hypothetical protein